MRLIDRLKATYPLKEFVMDPITGVISFTDDGCSITDPFVTDCGRFTVVPTMEYHITIEDAIDIFDHNEPLNATASLGIKGMQ